MLQVTIATSEELPQAFALRHEVFVVEQGVPAEVELDEYEPVCMHFLAWSDGVLLGTARLRELGGEGKAERVAVRRESRGLGVGAALMRALEAEAQRRGLPSVKLGAQITALPFYERLGYTAWGEVFQDGGLPHRWMRKALEPKRG